MIIKVITTNVNLEYSTRVIKSIEAKITEVKDIMNKAKLKADLIH